MSHPAIADGYLVTLDSMDNQIYCFGKGPTATTVTIQDDVIGLGDSVLITGMVTDESAGTKQQEQSVRFPNGVPAIADEDMTVWMEHLYHYRPCPDDAQGVEVVITTLDPNGNTYELGRATTDLSGIFGIDVNPPVPGLYKIMVTFEGSDSYYGSWAETYIKVEEAPASGQEMQFEQVSAESVTETAIITTEITIISAIAIACVIGVVAFWTLRKRK
jgi:hypothetical protein